MMKLSKLKEHNNVNAKEEKYNAGNSRKLTPFRARRTPCGRNYFFLKKRMLGSNDVNWNTGIVMQM